MNDEPIKVLLVEGDADESTIIKRLLEAAPGVADRPGVFSATEAPRLNTATHLLAREPYDAVLLDIVLPKSVGLEAFHKLREMRPELPVIVLTGVRDRALAESALAEGAQDYLVKGTLDSALLRRAVTGAIERARLAAEAARLRKTPENVEHETREAFMKKVSHELRNTVTTVKAAVYCLSDGLPDPLTPKQRQLIAMISRNVDRQVKTMDDVLDLSRLRAGRRKLEPETVEPGVLAEALAREAALRGGARPLELDLPCRLPSVQADPELLSQALRQLLDNAFKHAAAKVTLRVEPDGEGVLFSVIDDGPGVPPERLDQLFGDFVKVETAPGRPRGTGLGLAICREIAAAHGGKVWAENGATGARFRLSLPSGLRSAPAEPPRRRHAAPALPAAASQARHL
jgi:signal transduction histidine kinase